MGKYRRYLFDEIGREYKRKNRYLAELSEIDELLETKGKDKSELRSKRSELIAGKEKHPYVIQLKDYEKKEKLFKDKLKVDLSDFTKTLASDEKGLDRKLKQKLFASEIAAEFYKSFVDVSYDAEFEYKKAELTKKQLPIILENIRLIRAEIKALEGSKATADSSMEKSIKSDFESEKAAFKKTLGIETDRIKSLRKEGTISRKAEANSIREAKQKYRINLRLKRLEIPSNGIRDQLKSKKNELKNYTNQGLKILKSDIADIRKVTPVEVEKTKPVVSYATALLPGVGQGINGQLGKMLIMLFGSLFIYLIAIPYALGYGNYQGEGISGLISLAEGGARIDKSLIFMIEGVVSIFLLLLAALVLYVSFMDVYKVETGKIKGIRPKSWFENKKSIFEEGFPYVSSMPP